MATVPTQENDTPAQHLSKDNNSHSEEYTHAERHLRIAIWLNWITGAAAVIALVGLFFVYKQANNTSEQVTLMKKSLETSERGWVGLSSSTMDSFIAGKLLKASLAFTNTGKSPALNTTVQGNIKRSKSFDIVAFKRDKGRPVGPPSISSIFPNSTFYVPVQPGILTPEMFFEISSGLTTVYVFGDVTYNDIFGNAHTTEFCQLYDPFSNVFKTCSSGNTAN